MARIIYSGLVTSIRGSIGGTTFQNNAYGFTVKNKANMVKPNTVPQNLSKLVFSLAVKAWGQLTTANRANWNSWAATYPQFAKNNPSSVLSGFAVFVKVYANMLIGFGLAQTPTANPFFTLTALDTVTFVLHNTAGVLTLNQTWVTNDGSWNTNLYLSRPFGDSQNFSGTSPKFIVASDSTTIGLNITAAYTAAFGALPAVGSVVFIDVQLYNTANGQVPAKSSQRLIVVA
jgi:hypothetical protein